MSRTVRAPQIRRADASSRTKVAHVVPIRHRDQVEAPITFVSVGTRRDQIIGL